jgi:L-cysteine S-thiosulfotransferase
MSLPGGRSACITLLLVCGATSAAAQTQRSGFADMGAALQLMQRDDTQNPAMLWVQEGAALWQRVPASGRACAGCHGPVETAMRGVAARYPAFDTRAGMPLDLGQRIDQCRQRHQGLPPAAPDDQEALALESLVALQSRGMPVAPPADPRLLPFAQRGAALFNARLGQLDLSCAQCHDSRAGLRLGGSLIPQGHANGYPLYRLEWQGLGSLRRRLRNCMTGVRAEPFSPAAPEWVELALHLARRAAGMPMEAPAVRP